MTDLDQPAGRMCDRMQHEDGTRVRWDLLTSVPFVVSLALLALNDHVLKGALGNALTGKLSDFAGLFAFGVFVCAFAPGRERRALFCVALAFVVWKSPLAQPLIEGWNALPVYDVARVVDYTDLIALIVLPFALRQVPRQGRESGHRRIGFAMVPIALVLFAATSSIHVTPYTTDYYFDLSPSDLIALVDLVPGIDLSSAEANGDRYAWSEELRGSALVHLTGSDSTSRLGLREISLLNQSVDSTALRERFEQSFIEPLRRATRSDTLLLLMRLVQSDAVVPRPGDLQKVLDPSVRFAFGIPTVRINRGDVPLTLVNHSDRRIAIASCDIRHERYLDGGWVDAGPALHRCDPVRTRLDRPSKRWLVPVDWEPGIWRFRATVETADGPETFVSYPTVLGAEDRQGPASF